MDATAAVSPAQIYEQVFVTGLLGPCARRLVELAAPRTGERVLDVGTGTGIVARLAAPLVAPAGRVVGLDASPAMLAVAEETAKREGHAIEWREGKAEALPFADDSFDLVTAGAALMFFSDRPAAAAEMRRVLAPGGRVAVTVFQSLDRHPFYQELDDILQRRFGISGVGDIFAFGDAGAMRDLWTSAGFERVEVIPFSVDARYADPDRFLDMEIAIDTAVVPSLQHIDEVERRRVTSAIRDEIEPAFRRYVRGGEVVIPMHAHIALAS